MIIPAINIIIHNPKRDIGKKSKGDTKKKYLGKKRIGRQRERERHKESEIYIYIERNIYIYKEERDILYRERER